MYQHLHTHCFSMCGILFLVLYMDQLIDPSQQASEVGTHFKGEEREAQIDKVTGPSWKGLHTPLTWAERVEAWL